jgi:hypothetical protein
MNHERIIWNACSCAAALADVPIQPTKFIIFIFSPSRPMISQNLSFVFFSPLYRCKYNLVRFVKERNKWGKFTSSPRKATAVQRATQLEISHSPCGRSALVVCVCLRESLENTGAGGPTRHTPCRPGQARPGHVPLSSSSSMIDHHSASSLPSSSVVAGLPLPPIPPPSKPNKASYSSASQSHHWQ